MKPRLSACRSQSWVPCQMPHVFVAHLSAGEATFLIPRLRGLNTFPMLRGAGRRHSLADERRRRLEGVCRSKGELVVSRHLSEGRPIESCSSTVGFRIGSGDQAHGRVPEDQQGTMADGGCAVNLRAQFERHTPASSSNQTVISASSSPSDSFEYCCQAGRTGNGATQPEWDLEARDWRRPPAW